MKLFVPFECLSKKVGILSAIIIITIVFIIWGTSGSEYIPRPGEILSSFPDLMRKNVVDEFITSITFCLVSMFYASLISLVIGYLAAFPIFSVLCQFLRKFRFLPSVGLSFLFMKMTGSIDEQKSWMMIFGITTWLIYSMVGVTLSVSKDDVMYAKSLRLNSWQTMRELLIYGKAADMYQAIVGNFAIAWMLLASIENISKSSGGIGVILAESNKYYKFGEVYAIQILILLVGITIDYLGNQSKKVIFPYTKL